MPEEQETMQTSTSELLPPPDHPELGIRIFQILDKILKYREESGQTERWNRFYELRKNKHWKNPTNAKVPLVTANLLGSHHQKTVNTLTDNNPTFNATITGKVEDEEGLKLIVRLADHWWNETEQQHTLEESVSTMESYGTVIEMGSYDAEIEYPLGEVVIETIDLFNFGLYPVKCKQVQKAEGCLLFRPMTVREVKRKWPKHAKNIVSDSEYVKAINDQRQELVSGGKSGARTYVTTILDVVKNLVSTKGEKDKAEDELTVVVEAWVKDHSKDENGNYLYAGKIRRVRSCSCGNVILDDMSNPSINHALLSEDGGINGTDLQRCYLWDKFPFSKAQSVTDPASFYGISDYEQLEGLNIEVNKTISQMTMMKDKAAGLKILNPLDSGIPNSKFNNYPGVLNPISHLVAQGIKYVEPPKLDPTMLKSLEIYKDFFFTVAGTFDLESAQVPGREVIAYKAIAGYKAVLLE